MLPAPDGSRGQDLLGGCWPMQAA
uniref:Uncharacterized protein n=1 Tax=Arundo donax TaxID=35708 RepID=A0A0A9AP80_ARUDO